MDPNSKNTPQPGDEPERQTKPEERPLTDNERRRSPEQDQNDKVRRSNQAGDQDVDDTDDNESDR
jgi:hypothetical protein